MAMDFRLFQALLSAGFRLRAREQMLAMTASSFPHMNEKDRRKAVDALEKQTETAAAEDAGTTGGDVDKLRAWAQIDAMRHPMRPRTPQDAHDAASEDESEPDERG